MDRRKFLLTGGAGIVVIVGGGTAWQLRRWDSYLTEASSPWAAAGQSFGDVRLDCLAYAILAPNPHNLQPWLVRLDGTNELTLHYDTKKALPATDPLGRQLMIGCGAFLELLRQAAAERGYRLQEQLFPSGEPQPRLDSRPVARMRFVKAERAPRSDLFAYALARRTTRVPFKKKPVPAAVLRKLQRETLFDDATAGKFSYTAAARRVERLRANAFAAWKVEYETYATRAESVQWMRLGSEEIRDNPDGISLGGVFFELSSRVGLMTREMALEPGSAAYNGGLDFYNGLIETARAFGWLTTTTNTRRAQLGAGAAWLRLNLAATRDGLALHPLSQALQEFPEMTAAYNEIHKLLDAPLPSRVQGFFRFGYADAPPPAPRWAMRSHLIKV